MKNVTIECASGEERKVLAYIEKKYPNVEWRSGKRPTDVPDHYFYDNGTLINVCQNRISCISATEPNFYGDPVVTAEKFLKKDSKPSIVIFRRDREVIAKNVATGDKGVAKCSPTDEFCFKTGAAIAMARLMSKTPEVLNHDVKDEWIKVLGLTPVEKRVYTEAMLDKWDESKIHEGDTVKVINTGLNYSSYVKWVGEHISDPYMAARFCFGSPSIDKNYKVIKIAEHERNHRPLAYIEEIDGLSYNRCYLIEVKGLEKA